MTSWRATASTAPIMAEQIPGLILSCDKYVNILDKDCHINKKFRR
jgi:hypothetical protein